MRACTPVMNDALIHEGGVLRIRLIINSLIEFYAALHLAN